MFLNFVQITPMEHHDVPANPIFINLSHINSVHNTVCSVSRHNLHTNYNESSNIPYTIIDMTRIARGCSPRHRIRGTAEQFLQHIQRHMSHVGSRPIVMKPYAPERHVWIGEHELDSDPSENCFIDEPGPAFQI